MTFLFGMVFFLAELFVKNNIGVFIVISLMLLISYNLYYVIKEFFWMRSFKRLLIMPSTMMIEINNKSHIYKSLALKFIEYYGVTETGGVPFKRWKVVVNYELSDASHNVIIDREARKKKITVLKEILSHLGIRYEELVNG